MAAATRDASTLFALLDLARDELPAALAAARDFRVLAPQSYIQRMRRGDPRDPLLLQVLPQAAELLEPSGYSDDPVGDLDARGARGLLHKYHGRALMIVTGACAVHCRYCFRRHFPYADEQASGDNWREALAYLREATDVREVILSGGDPLLLADHKLAALVEQLAEIPHLETLRIHSRLPVVLPSRVDEALCGWLSATRLNCVLVLHANHAQEIDADVERACRALRQADVLLLNQSVLLADINDDAAQLASLSARLFQAGVLPYYLHLLDRVRGAAHFEVSEARAKALMTELHAQLPGYLLPRLVREVAGEPGKTLINWPDQPATLI